MCEIWLESDANKNRFSRTIHYFGLNIGTYHALTGPKTANISETKAYIKKQKTARESTDQTLSVREIP